MNKIETFLSKIGKEIKRIANFAFTKILPVAAKVAVAAEPLVDVAFPQIGPEYNLVANNVLAIEQAAALLPSGMTGEQKFAAVISAVSSKLLPGLEAAGLTTAEATAKLTTYVQAVVTILNTFAVTPSTQAA
ncbi:MAG: hypothetical protein CXZ00_02990 [Acidobacteria bacterium]|nr:MAG: hypothetical protein CXZ00_02990 [Acidobacteriota bacterium]